MLRRVLAYEVPGKWAGVKPLGRLPCLAPGLVVQHLRIQHVSLHLDMYRYVYTYAYICGVA